MLEKLSIRTQILATFAALAVVSLVVVSAVSLGNVNLIGNLTEDQATEALEDQIKRNILTTSSENAEVIEKKFKNAEAAVRKIARATESIFSGDIEFDPIESYHDDNISNVPDVIPADQNEYGEPISPTTSTYYHFPDYLDNGGLTSQQNSTIELSAHLDSVFASIYAETDEYVWLYVAFSEAMGNTFRNFPGADVPNDYDPQSDFYFDDAQAAGQTREANQQLGDLVYVSPYFDPTQGLVITLSQAVYLPNTNTLIGVVGLDFKSSVLRDKVLDVSFLESGYASLMETDTELTIAHPDFNPQVEADAYTPITDLEDFTSNKVDEITSGAQNVTTYTQDGEVWYLAYAPIIETEDESTEYVFLISVLASEVIEPVDQIRLRIDSSVSTIRTSVITLSILTLIGTVLVGLWIASNITRPVDKLTKIARQITRNATKEDIFSGVDFGETLETDDEIGDLTRSFESMVSKLREEQRQKGKKD